MSTSVSPEELFQQGSTYFQSYQLEKALEIMSQLHLQSQLQNGSELSFHKQILWCNILLAKNRFSGNPSYAQLALYKLEELQQLLPPAYVHSGTTSLPLLVAQAHFQLNNLDKARRLIEQFLSARVTAEFFVGQVQAYTLLGFIAIASFKLPKALEFARKIQALLTEYSTKLSSQELSATYDFLSTLFLKQEDYTQANVYANQLEELGQENTHLQEPLIIGKLQLAQIAIAQQQYESAMLKLVQAKSLSKKIRQENLYARSILYIGNVYTQVTSYQNAIDNFIAIQEGYDFLLQTPSYKHLYNSALGKSCYYTNQLATAETHFAELVASAEKNQDKNALILGLAYLSNIQTAQKKFKKALMLAKRTNNLIEQIGTDVAGLQLNLINLGNIHYQLGKYSEAVKLTSRGITASKRLKDELSEIKGYQVMSSIFQKQKDYKNALLYQTIYSKFFEDFFLRNDRQKIREIEQDAIIQELKDKGNKYSMSK